MRKEFNKIHGRIGEFDASEYLKKQNYKIIDQNYKNKIGEIDIIAQKDKTIVFVEVKKRLTLQFSRPCEAVTPYKQNKIRKVAQLYLMQKKIDLPCRFDIIEVLDEEINHIENAF